MRLSRIIFPALVSTPGYNSAPSNAVPCAGPGAYIVPFAAAKRGLVAPDANVALHRHGPAPQICDGTPTQAAWLAVPVVATVTPTTERLLRPRKTAKHGSTRVTGTHRTTKASKTLNTVTRQTTTTRTTTKNSTALAAPTAQPQMMACALGVAAGLLRYM
jgi:hypothetical protein